VNRRGNPNAVLFLPGLKHLGRPVNLTLDFTRGHLLNFSPPLIAMTTAEVTPFGEMPLNEKLKVFYCRTGNHVLFQLFHLRHRLPGSAARIIAQNFASCRLASPFMETFFLVFIPSTPFPYDLAWVKMGCGIPVNYHLYSDDTTGKNTKMAGKVNKVKPVFYEGRGCILKFL
jgi:hypothetical protein